MYTSDGRRTRRCAGTSPVAAACRVEENWCRRTCPVSTMVTTPASTGITAISRNAVISQVHTEQRQLHPPMPGALFQHGLR